jgi:mono/diheme cytochrome c family protein
MATESDNVNTGALATIVIVGALAMIGITTALTALVRTQAGDKQDQMDSTANLKAYQQMVASQRKELEEPPSWDDKAKGIVRIPIERAEQLVVTDLAKNPASASPAPPDAGATSPAALGKSLYTSQGCSACHSLNGKKGVGPSWKGIWGTTVKLAGGGEANVDEGYIHESIVNPQAKIVDTFPPVMPSYNGKLKDNEITALIEYIKTLK